MPEDPPGDGFCYLEGLLEEQECWGNDYPDTCECYQKKKWSGGTLSYDVKEPGICSQDNRRFELDLFSNIKKKTQTVLISGLLGQEGKSQKLVWDWGCRNGDVV